MNGFVAVYLREMLILKYRFKRQLAGMAVSPLLYLITFGYAMGDLIRFGEQSYLHFLIPGLVAMARMDRWPMVFAQRRATRRGIEFAIKNPPQGADSIRLLWDAE